MIRQSKEIITIAGKKVSIPSSDLRKVRELIRNGAKIDAIGVIRRHTRIGVKDVKTAIEDPHLFEQRADADSQDQPPPRLSLVEQFRLWRAGEINTRQLIQSNRSPVIGAAAAMLVLSLSIVTAAAWDGGHARNPKLWYYDLETHELFTSRRPLPPIAAPSNDNTDAPTGVRAYVFACGACSAKGEGEFIGYLETFSDEATDLYRRVENGEELALNEEELWKTVSQGHRIRDEPNDRWVPFDNEDGRQIRANVATRCPNTNATPCYPR